MRVTPIVLALVCVAAAADRRLQTSDETPAPTPSRPTPSPPTTKPTTTKPTTTPPTTKPTPPPTEEPTDPPTEAPTTTKATPKPTTLKPTPEPTPEPTDPPTTEAPPETSRPPRTTVLATDPPSTSKPKTSKPTPAPTEEIVTSPPATTAPDTTSGLPGWIVPTIVGGAVFVFVTVIFMFNRLRRHRDSEDYGHSELSPYSVNPHGTYQGAPVRKVAVLPPVNNNTSFMTNNSSFMHGQTPNYLYENDAITQDRSSIGMYDGRNSSMSFDRGSVPSFDGRSSNSYERSSGYYESNQSGRPTCLDDDIEARRNSALGSFPPHRITSPQSLQSYTF